MKQKTTIGLNAFACGSYFATLISSIMHGSVVFSLVMLTLLIVQGAFLVVEYSDD